MLRPPIAFRETVRSAAVGERKYIRHFEGRGHFAHLKLQLLPVPGHACSVTCVPELSLPEDCYHAVRAALFSRLDCGPAARYPMHGVEVRLLEATHLPRHSHPEAFALAAGMAFDEALLAASPVILEPWTGLRLNVEQNALVEVLGTLTMLIGNVDVSVSFTETFVLKVEIPRGLLPRICQMLGLCRPLTFSLPASREYRPLQGAAANDDRTRPGFEDWT
ncbi:translation elongation factor EF-G [Silvibacterium bohemicum]|uniref:Translation elongation factor EF-G n=1 Tax=Silvibacterium bohemicum TaxID=1577686 RepID=A0A841K5W8_9BACT|nr:hypothetical protein [Silvibacterium bohemicum]MBB6146531.1 translation elongation factor EF-G [Silvibacterium bohemicum]